MTCVGPLKDDKLQPVTLAAERESGCRRSPSSCRVEPSGDGGGEDGLSHSTVSESGNVTEESCEMMGEGRKTKCCQIESS